LFDGAGGDIHRENFVSFENVRAEVDRLTVARPNWRACIQIELCGELFRRAAGSG
jgi:hypothetical protein